jgi:translocation and assembly module TamB
VQELNDATGARAEIGALEFRPASLTADIYNVILQRKGDAKTPPLLRVDKVMARLSIKSLLLRKLILNELRISHPVVNVVTERAATNSSLQVSRIPTGSRKSRVDLTINHLLISNGEINYENKRIPLDAEFYDLGTETHFDPHTKHFKSSLSYNNGRLHYLNCAPVRHSLTVTFDVAPSRIAIESARVTVGSSTGVLRGELDDFSSPRIDADYDLQIHTQDFGVNSSSVTPVGDILLTGRIRYKHAPNRPLLRNFSIDGDLRSDAFAVSSPDGLVESRKLHAIYELANGALRVREGSAELMGGQAKIDVDIQHLESTPVYQIAVSLERMSLQAIQEGIRRAELKRVTVNGILSGTANVSWAGNLSTMVSRCDLHLEAVTDRAMNRPNKVLSVQGDIHVTYNRERHVMMFQPTSVHISSMNIVVQGEASDQSDLQIRMVASDLTQLSTVVSALRFRKIDLPEISGSGVLNAMMRGSVQNPTFVGQLNGQNVGIEDSRWNSVMITAEVSSSRLVISKASLVHASQGMVFLSGSVGLHDWSYLPSNSTSVNLLVQRLRVGDLHGMARLDYPASGELYADVKFHGSGLDPVGSGTVRLANAVIYNESLRNVMLEFHASHGSVKSTVNIGFSGGTAVGSFFFIPKTRAYKLRLDAPSVVLQELRVVRLRDLPLNGVVEASVVGEGTLDNPRLTAILGMPHAEFRQNPISQLRAEVHVADRDANFELSSRMAEASVRVHGHVNLTGAYYCEAAVDTGILRLDHLLGTYLTESPAAFQANTEFHAILKGPLKEVSQLEAHLTIPTMAATYATAQISTAYPIVIDYAHSVVTLRAAEFQGSGTSLRVHGSMTLHGISDLKLNAQGSVDATLFRIIDPHVRSSGVLSFDVRTTGSVANPSIQGQLKVQEFALSTATGALGLENVNGSLTIEKNRVRVSQLTGQVGGGQLSMSGSILYWPDLQFDVTLQAKEVRLRYPGGLRTLLDSNLALTGKSTGSTLNGRIVIDDLSFTPDFDVAKLSEQISSRTAPQYAGFGDSVKLAVAVQSKNRLSANSSLASVEGNVNLQVIGTVASPVMVGRLDLTSGEFFYRSRRYEVERGIVVFDDPNQTRAALDISATTTVQQYNLTLTLRGYLDRLITSYASDPPLATADIINLIAVGKTTQGADSAGRGTDSILASQAAGQFSSKMQTLTGISGLQIDPLLGGSNRDPSARIAIQQRVTKNFLFTFSTDVSQPGRETVEGKYQFNRRWSLGVARDPVGGIAVDGRYHTRF